MILSNHNQSQSMNSSSLPTPASSQPPPHPPPSSSSSTPSSSSSSSSSTSTPTPTRRIQALPKTVVDRIAAGEVVQRPASVVKELIENSLDAKSTLIDVACTAGGMRVLTIADDGCGIHPADLSLAAMRFATSKLRQLDDLKSVQTFGFRGEALASASMVGRLSITSRCRKRKLTNGNGNGNGNGSANGNGRDKPSTYSSACAYKMSYRDGNPVSGNNNNNSNNNNSNSNKEVKVKPAPSAGKEGTTVKLEDLFYNLPSRKRAFEGTRKENEEYQRILIIVQKYAVHMAHCGVGFVCRKRGGATDLNTSSMGTVKKLKDLFKERERSAMGRGEAKAKEKAKGGSKEDNEAGAEAASKKLQEQATKDAIGHIYGCGISRELLQLECGEGNVEEVSLAALRAMMVEDQCNNIDNDNDDYGGGSVNDNTPKMPIVNSLTMPIDDNSLAHGLLMGTDYGAIIAEETGSGSNLNSNSKRTKKENKESKSKTQIQYNFAFKASGLITNGSYCVPKSSSAFLLFINGRLVESAPLRRAVEGVYQDTLPKNAKPFVYLSLELPGPHLDVNVHPTKREVAFLYEDRLCHALANATRDLLRCATTSRTFYAQTLLPATTNSGSAASASASTSANANTNTNANATSSTAGSSSLRNKMESNRSNGAKRRRMATLKEESSQPVSSIEDNNNGDNDNSTIETDGNKSSGESTSANPLSADVADDDDDNGNDNGNTSRSISSSAIKNEHNDNQKGGGRGPSPPKKKKVYDPKNLVRTDPGTQPGALEPFLVPTQPSQSQQTQSQSASNGDGSSTQTSSGGSKAVNANVIDPFQHAPDCEFATKKRKKIDMSIPGAFTSICRCQVERAETLPSAPASSSSGPIAKVKKITPTECSYSSIEALRKDIPSRSHGEYTSRLRDAVFVGCINRKRSLIQSGTELVMINHYELARELFYQVAVLRFGGFEMATLRNGGVDVKMLIEHFLSYEEDSIKSFACLSQHQGDNTNSQLAKHAVQCLSEQADMLEEYFSIRFETKTNSKSNNSESESKSDKDDLLMLTGLPILLDGHIPSPHALPEFLMRLATEVDFSEERPCFEGICTELGRYYAEVPESEEEEEEELEQEPKDADKVSGDKKELLMNLLVDEAGKKFVQHTLFPALRFLLVFPKDLAANGSFSKLAQLSKLYKVFER